MSGTELKRLEVLAEVVSRRRTEASAAAILSLSTRQTRRLIVALPNERRSTSSAWMRALTLVANWGLEWKSFQVPLPAPD